VQVDRYPVVAKGGSAGRFYAFKYNIGHPNRKLFNDAVLAFMRLWCIFWTGDRFSERRCDSSGVAYREF
jgi:hypothetical protein